MKKHPNNGRIFSILALLGLFACLPVEAVSLYKWVDEDGRIHYSQTPPATSSTQSKQMQMKDSNPYQSEEQKAETEDMEANPATTEAGAEVVETRRKNCELARKNLDVFKNSDRVIQPDGTMLILSEEMRANKIKESQALVDVFCN